MVEATVGLITIQRPSGSRRTARRPTTDIQVWDAVPFQGCTVARIRPIGKSANVSAEANGKQALIKCVGRRLTATLNAPSAGTATYAALKAISGACMGLNTL